jgi:hypothetical protein
MNDIGKWTEWVMSQAPMVTVTIVVCVIMYRYFTKKENEYKIVVKEKDLEIKTLNIAHKDDLHRSHSNLLDFQAALKEWILKDEQNTKVNEIISTTLDKINVSLNEVLSKLSDK